MMMASRLSPDPVSLFDEALAEGGVRGALRFLNSRTRHRFTSVYRFDGRVLRNLHLYDRENPGIAPAPEASLDESYCSIVSDTAAPFVTCDSLGDARVHNHPKREAVLSYCGVPLVRADRTLFGTLCHFDFVPRNISQDEVKLLEAVAPRLLRALENS